LPRISSSAESGKGRWSQLYLGVAFTTLATLILELSLTRIFSVVFYYHFAFLAISIALFGLGAGGVFSYVVSGWRGNTYFKLGTLAVLNSFCVVASLVFLLTRSGELTNLTLAAVYFASALPFFFSGTVVSMAVAEGIQRVDRVYFFDLLGAAAGCLALVPLLDRFGGPNTVLVTSVMFAVSAAIWYNIAGTLRGRVAAVALALGFVVLIAYNGTRHTIDVRYAKGRPIPQEKFVQWNSFSRIGLVDNNYPGEAGIVIDADAATGIPGFDLAHLTPKEKDRLVHEGPGFPYMLRPGAKTLVIGSGGGWDVARALTSGSQDVTAVEINPIIARTIMQQRFPELSHRLYFRPEVHVVIEDGRSFVRRSTDKYQVLQATLVDTWASTAAGAFALSENNLYTTDAFHDYLTHLTDDGLMVFTRWGLQPPRESLRLISLTMAALQDLGEKQAWKHIVVVRENAQNLAGWGAQDTVIVFRKPISDADLARVRSALAETKLQPVYIPDDLPANEFGRLLRSDDPETFRAEYAFDISPVDDDRPFFFYTVQPRDLLNFLTQSARAADYKINRAVPLLFELLGVSLLATIVVLALPPLLLGSRLKAEHGVRSFLLYFIFIGAGYVLIQVALIQKFVLFLGHPTYALTVIIFSMLISSGVGSYFSRRLVGKGSDFRLGTVLIAVAAAVCALAFLAAPISESGMGWPLALKIVVTVALVAPAGFLMGMPFPIGLARLGALYPRAVRWAWALNAAASVLGSAAAIFFAIYLGLRATVLLGAVLYLGALAVVWLRQRAAVVVAPAGAELRA
jgi:predicted MFS family arabinose efflux permease